MVVLSEGRRGAGFYVCSECGAGLRRTQPHETPYGTRCSAKADSILRQVSLGHELLTDVVRLEFCADPRATADSTWFTFSLAYALAEGVAEVLGVPPNDLNATVSYGSNVNRLPPIILYDSVPGGAGLVACLEDRYVLGECLHAAHARVAGACGCGENTSCYGCLRSYRNQFAHNFLQRGPVKQYLERILPVW
jgi:hypothetical protein